MAVDESNPLYDACVGFMVAEKSEEDSWEKVAKFVAAHQQHLDWDKLLQEFKTVEAQVKHDFKVRTLPTAWRTAKSVALAAARNDVALLNPAGDVRGKSEVQAVVKVAGIADAPNLVDKAVNHLAVARGLIHGLRITKAERDKLTAHLIALGDAMGTTVDA